MYVDIRYRVREVRLNMVKVDFYDSIDDKLLKFAVIVSKYQGKWVFCKHKERDTYEYPGGHREENEMIFDTAKRELWEETGASDYNMEPICVYSVKENEIETFGMLYFAKIMNFEQMPTFEMEKIELLEKLPTKWTYPLIQPVLIKKVEELCFEE